MLRAFLSSGSSLHKGLAVVAAEPRREIGLAADRAKWLQAAAAEFDLMYKGGVSFELSRATDWPRGDGCDDKITVAAPRSSY